MKTTTFIVALIGLINMTVAQSIQPFLLCSESTDQLSEVQSRIESVLEDYSFQLVGQFTPPYAPHTKILAITSPDLKGAAKQVGGLASVTSVWKLLLREKDGKVQVSYPNPEYWGNAFFRDEFYKVEFSRYMAMSGKLSQVCAAAGDLIETGYGSSKAISASELQEAVPAEEGTSSDHIEVLKTFESYQLAVQTIDSNLNQPDLQIDDIYRLEMPDANTKLYGFGLKTQDVDHAVPLLPEDLPPDMDYLPVEVLVREGEVHMLNSHFIIPMIFPDKSVEALKGAIKYYESVKKLIEPVFASAH